MIVFLTYLLKVWICSGILYAYYVLALRNSTLHHWNRGYIIGSTFLSLFLPLVKLPLGNSSPMVFVLPQINVHGYIMNNTPQTGQDFPVSTLLAGLYILVTFLLVMRIVVNWFRMQRLINGSTVEEKDGYRLLRHPQVLSPFSFFNNIFWSPDITPGSEASKQVLLHELAHVNGRHSMDKLLMEVVCALSWANPFFFFFKKELGMVHEFIADKAASGSYAADDYARTILQMTLQTRILTAGNSFTMPPVKRRIYMLFTHKTTNTTMKKTIIFPLVLVLALVLGNRQHNTIMAGPVPAKAALADTEKIFTVVSDHPEFPGGTKELGKYLMQNIRYPATARKAGVGGTVFVQFVVDSDGNIGKPKTVGRKLGYGLEEEALRVVAGMPKWTPGKDEGKPVSVAFTLPIQYKLDKQHN